MENAWVVATIWMALAFAASVISVRLGLSVALVEILLGVLAGNFFGLKPDSQWIGFLAMVGSVMLTFLAGAEIDPESFRANLRASLSIGILSFLLPFLGVWAFAQYVLGWGVHQAQIAGIALSTTSVAVVYAVMIERGLSNTNLGKMLLAACFITDLGTVLALGVLFARPGFMMFVFIGVMLLALWIVPRVAGAIIGYFGAEAVSEPEVKFILMVLFFLGALASAAGSEAMLPAYLIGLMLAGLFVSDKVLVERMRSVAFTLLTPFYFIRAGTYVSLKAVAASAAVIGILLLLKMVTKALGVWPLSRYFHMSSGMATYTTLLMSTGLTFGTIAALYGLNNGIIDQAQYTILVTVVILSAVVPTLIAQHKFEPTEEEMNAWDHRGNGS
ncbi:cation:proton antiporter [Coprothermobacteraceae bacterium]|nr:cation:proton antiporter [Coprothermobacteraceae bacterium]